MSQTEIAACEEVCLHIGGTVTRKCQAFYISTFSGSSCDTLQCTQIESFRLAVVLQVLCEHFLLTEQFRVYWYLQYLLWPECCMYFLLLSTSQTQSQFASPFFHHTTVGTSSWIAFLLLVMQHTVTGIVVGQPWVARYVAGYR